MSLSREERQKLIQQYAEGTKRLASALAKVPESVRKWKPAAGKWSVHEVVCHCADSEMNSAIRIRFLLAENHPTIQGYDQDGWAENLGYHDHPIEAALAMVEAARGGTVPLLRRLKEEDWQRQGVHTESGPYTVEKWMQIYADHLEVHSRQIERNLEAWKSSQAR